MKANVRVVPSGANYPTVSSMVQVSPSAFLLRLGVCVALMISLHQAMEARRDIAEELVGLCFLRASVCACSRTCGYRRLGPL